MWSNAARVERDVEVSGETGIVINGSFVGVTPGADFIDTCLEQARNAGLMKFRVFLDNDELDVDDAPAEFQAGDVVKIIAYDEAGWVAV